MPQQDMSEAFSLHPGQVIYRSDGQPLVLVPAEQVPPQPIPMHDQWQIAKDFQTLSSGNTVNRSSGQKMQ